MSYDLYQVLCCLYKFVVLCSVVSKVKADITLRNSLLQLQFCGPSNRVLGYLVYDSRNVNNTLTTPFCFVVLDKLYCNLYVTCNFVSLKPSNNWYSVHRIAAGPNSIAHNTLVFCVCHCCYESRYQSPLPLSGVLCV